MSRRRAAAILIAGVLLGFFAAFAAFDLGAAQRAPQRAVHAVAPQDAGAAAAKLAAVQSAQYGAKQAAVHLAAKRTSPIVPFIRTLKLRTHDDAGDGPGAVTELQRALIRARVKPRPLASGSFGLGTEAALKAFQREKKIPASGIYGPATHHQLSPFYDLSGRRALQAAAHTRTVLAIQAKIVGATSLAWKHRLSMAYSQSASRAFIPASPLWPRATDCSGYVTWAFRSAGLPDPNGFAYSPVGYTGTLAQHGTRVSLNSLRTGDLIFYGGGFPYGHVAIVVNGFLRLVSSHGSPGIKVLPFNYRPPSAARRYF